MFAKKYMKYMNFKKITNAIVQEIKKNFFVSTYSRKMLTYEKF